MARAAARNLIGGMLSLLAVGSCERPVSDQESLRLLAAEGAMLMRVHGQAGATPVTIEAAHLPPMIASLKPDFVSVTSRNVAITTKAYFDGGWGYGIAGRRADLGMLPDCCEKLSDTVYWHGPC